MMMLVSRLRFNGLFASTSSFTFNRDKICSQARLFKYSPLTFENQLPVLMNERPLQDCRKHSVIYQKLMFYYLPILSATYVESDASERYFQI